MHKTIIAALTAAVVATGFMVAAPATAQQGATCANHDQLAEVLGQRFESQRTGLGIIGQSAVVEVYVSEAGNWTILMTRTDGISCIVASGHSWEAIPVLVGQAV